MKSSKSLLSKFTLATVLSATAFSVTACNKAESVEKAIALDSPDSAKIAYVFGSQLSSQVFKFVPVQVGEGLSEDALVQGFNDAFASFKDTTKTLALHDSVLQKIGFTYSQKAQARFASIQPDSLTSVSLTPPLRQAYLDSAIHTLSLAPEAPVTGKSVVISETSNDIEKFSYMFGVNFASQLQSFGTQIGIDLSVHAAIEGLRDGHRMAKDSTFKGLFAQDSLNAINQRVNELSRAAREKQIEAQKEEKLKLDEALDPLRGDTLADGMPSKINFEIAVKGFNVEASNLSAYAGKPLLVFYFSATCGHCKKVAPEIVELSKTYKDLATIAVASSSGSQKQIRQFLEDSKIEFPVVQDTEREFGELYSDGYVPKVYLVNADGSYNIYKSFGNQKEELQKDIEALLQGKNVEHKIEAPKEAS